jgi:hypothetical protein
MYKQFAPSLFLFTQVTSLKWGMLNPDALESGSLGNTFLFTDSVVETAQGLNRQIEFIQQGGSPPSYADAQILLKAKINLPGPGDSLRCILQMLAVCRADLPPAHPLVTFLCNHYAFMKVCDPGWATYSMYVPALPRLKGVYHLQWQFLKVTKFFSQIECNLNKACCPDPHKIINLIQEEGQKEPNLTETFTARYNLWSFLGLHTPSGKSSIPSAASTLVGTSLISGLTLSTLVGGSAKPVMVTNKGVDLRVKNLRFDEVLFGTYKTSALKAKIICDEIKAGTIPPLPASKLDGTTPMCLAWHTKGVCNMNCPCISDHVAYTADKYAPMVTWCRNHSYASA